MKVMIVGDYPKYIGGVSNYTRPLHQALSLYVSEIHYLYSSGGYKKNYNFLLFPYIKTQKKTDKIFWHEIVNASNGIINFYNPLIDISSPSTEKLVKKLLNSVLPDIIHIHEMIGLSSKIIQIAKEMRIKVIVSVHEYWWLCLHRVMIDFNGEICEGPKNFEKCSICVLEKYRSNKKDRKLVLAIKNQTPKFFNFLHFFYSLLKSKNKQIDFKKDNISEKKQIERHSKNLSLVDALLKRFNKNIEFLNNSDLVIGVSNEVKSILERYGVNGNKMIVQHIGSEIASKEIKIKPKSRIDEFYNFGFIGGVTYYKGVHILVEAFLKLNISNNQKLNLLIFGKYDPIYKKEIDNKFKNDKNYNRVMFFGRYQKDDLSEIYSKIDIMVLPSICNDTAPQTIFESYAAGIPIIGPNIGGFPDFIKHNINGLLFEVGNVNDLKLKMEFILNKPSIIYEFKRNIPKLKTIDENAKELILIYKEVMGD